MLQREFGIGADEALYVRPVWELNNLIAQHQRAAQAAEED